MDRIATYQSYLEDKPDDRFAMYSLALELKRVGRLEEAERAFDALLSLHPTSGAGHYQLGLMYEEADREEDARVAWERGLAALEGCTDERSRGSVREIEAALDLLD